MNTNSDPYFIDFEFGTIIVNKLTSMNRTIHKRTGRTDKRKNGRTRSYAYRLVL